MGLAQYQVERATVALPKGDSMSVRGLNTEDVSALFSARLDDIDELYRLFSEAKVSIYSRKAMDGFILTAVRKAPRLVAEVISRAADEEAVEQAAKLPFGVTANALGEVLRLTLSEAGDLKNLMAILASVAEESLPKATLAKLGSLSKEMMELRASDAVKH